MGFTYALFHWFVHFFLTFLIIFSLRLDFFYSFLCFLSTIIIDLDHLPVLVKKDFKKILELSKAGNYFFHNLFFLTFFILLAILSIYFFLLWDFFEDIFIFKMEIKHWLIKKNIIKLNKRR